MMAHRGSIDRTGIRTAAEVQQGKGENLVNRNASSSQPRKLPTRIAVIALLLVGLIAMVFVGFIMTLAFGGVAGEEFSADSFSRRSFWYYQVPLLGLQITPIYREDMTNELESALQTRGCLPPATDNASRWDLASATHDGGESLVHGDASILCDYLDAVDQDGKHLWLTWTDEHPQLAQQFWPEVARLARRQLYMFLPALFEIAGNTTEAPELSRKLRQEILRQYQRLADIQSRRGDTERAAQLLEEAADYQTDLKPESES
jgi:hypothetical protein